MIVVASILCGSIVGPLTYFASLNVASAVLGGVAATGAALVALPALIR
ncbi:MULTISPECIES: hypothetical protein [Actinosynnema]|nr:hypothetical protein [Actinosynnema pretiosum]